MKPLLAILLFVVGGCAACELRPTSSQTPKNTPAAATPSPTTTATISDNAPCSLVMDQAPVVKGLRLGMTSEQVLGLFPGSSEDPEVRTRLSRPPNQFGETGFTIRPAKDQDKPNENLTGMTHIVVDLLDGHASRYYVGYDGPEYAHVDQFVAKFVEGTNLPGADQWEAYVGMDTQLKTLKCKDFEIKVFVGGKGGNLNYVDMRDLKADNTVEDRRKKAEKTTP